MIKYLVIALVLVTDTVWAQNSVVTSAQSTAIEQAQSRVAAVSNSNSVYIDQNSNQDSIHIDQHGRYNKVTGTNSSPLIISGYNNSLYVLQGDPVDQDGKNLIEASIRGHNNNLTVKQAINVNGGVRDGQESGEHFTSVTISGNQNTVEIRQANAAGVNSGHYANIDVSGNNNNIITKQSSNSAKTIFGSIQGNQNSINLNQSDNSAAFMDLSVLGNNHSLTTLQKSNGAHKSTITLVNSGGAVTAEITQQGNTANNLSLYQSCINPIGCSVSVIQTTP